MPEDPDWEEFFVDIIAVTGWDYEQIFKHTYPQLLSIYNHRNRMIYPHIKPILEYMFAKAYSDEKGKELDKFIKKTEQTLIRHKEGGKQPELSPEDKKRKKAWDYYTMEYLGIERVVEKYFPSIKPKKKRTLVRLPVSPAACVAILEWLKEEQGNACPNEVWIRDLMPTHHSLLAQGGQYADN